jgi:hypothetical protein
MSTFEALGHEDIAAGAAAVAELLDLLLQRQALQQEEEQQRDAEVVQWRGLEEGSGGGKMGWENLGLSKLYVFW